MHRRPLGNGRRLALIGAHHPDRRLRAAVVLLGGDGGLPRQAYTAFDGTGIVSFFAALATLALIALPYAAGDRARWRSTTGSRSRCSRSRRSWACCSGSPTVVEAPEGLLPDRAYGFWISALGAVILARAAYDIWLEPPRR